MNIADAAEDGGCEGTEARQEATVNWIWM